MDPAIPILILLLLFLLIIAFLLLLKLKSLRKELSELQFRKSSQSVKYGKLTEQFIPFTEQFPFSAERFRFLGEPIDGIVFEDNEIVLCEFKTASSRLNEKQRKIKGLVESKKVKWLEFDLK